MPTYQETEGPDFVLPQFALPYQELFPPAKKKEILLTNKDGRKKNEIQDQHNEIKPHTNPE